MYIGQIVVTQMHHMCEILRKITVSKSDCVNDLKSQRRMSLGYCSGVKYIILKFFKNDK